MQDPQKEPADQLVLQMDRTNSKQPYSNEKPPPKQTSNSTRSLPKPKPKSRFVQSTYPQSRKPSDSDDPNGAAGDQLNSSDDEEDDDDLFEEEDEEKLKEKNRRKKWKVGWRTIPERATFVVILACLVTSLTAQSWKSKYVWGLVIWKWVLMVMVVFSGRLVSTLLVGLLAFLIERNFMRREKVVYFVYGLRKSVRNCIWLGLVLLSWYVMFNPEVEDPKHTHGFRKRVLRVLIAVTIGSVMWLVKIILVKVLASSFHVATFFDRMKVSVFHYVILEKLSDQPVEDGTPSGDPTERKKSMGRAKSMPANISRGIGNGSRHGSRRIDVEKLKKMSQTNPSPYTVKRLVSHVMNSGLSSISRTVDQTMEDFKETESDMTSELEARMCAKRIFNIVAKDGEKYIDEDDLLRFLDKEEIEAILDLFPGVKESRKIRKSAFRNWVVEAYRERQALAHSLNDTKTAVQQLHKVASAVVIVIIIIMSLLVMGVTTSKVILVSSQLVLVAFMFGSTCKTIFESIIFVFVMHPFDTGDRCVIDGVQMIVEEMNILTTVFIRYDNEKIYFPNSVLLTKPISNFNRSPQMGDSVEFAIDAATEVDNFTKMKDAIKGYIESRPKYWQPKHHVVVKEIENVNRMKIVLYFTHTINYQDYIEKLNRRSELVFELKKIFESHKIKYHLLPQQVQLVNGDQETLK